MKMERWALRVRALWSVKLHGSGGGGGGGGEKKHHCEKLLKNKLNLIVSLENHISS